MTVKDGRSRAWALGLCFLAALIEGFDIQSAGVAAPKLAPALSLTREQLGPVFSASIFGLFIGAIVFGRLADRVGRKWTLIGSVLVFGIFSLATARAWNLESLLVIRVLAGFGLGGAMPNLIALAAEAAPPGKRAGMVALITSGMPFGGAVAGAIAAIWPWEAIFVVGGLAPLLLAPIMAVVLRESAAFKAATSAGAAPAQGFVHALTGERRALTTLLVWVAFFFTLLVLYLLLNWLPILMTGLGLSRTEASLVSLLFNVGGGVGTLALGVLIDRGRRGLLMVGSYLGMAASLFALAMSAPAMASAGVAGFAAGVFVIGAQLALYGLAPELYPTASRGTGVGSAVAIGRLGAVAGPLLAAAILAGDASSSHLLLAILPAVLVGGVAAVAMLSRPKVND